MTDAMTQSPDRPDARPGTSAAFVTAFRTGWSLGSGADEFCEHFLPTWVDPDVTLVQPLAPTAHGFDGFRRFAEQVFALAPDLRCDVVTERLTADGAVLELRFHGTVEGRGHRVVGSRHDHAPRRAAPAPRGRGGDGPVAQGRRPHAPRRAHPGPRRDSD